MNTSIPPFYFTAVFWGEEFRNYFLDYLVASLLAPNNIPILDNKQDARFVIVAPKEDWELIQDAAIFKLLKEHITPVWFEIPMPDNEDPDFYANKMKIMSNGHKICTDFVHQAKAIGVYPTPDLVFSDGTVKTLQRYAYEGKKVVLTLAIRFEYYGCIKSLRRHGVLKPGKPLAISSRKLVKIGLKNLHSETKQFLWDEKYYSIEPISCLWALSPNKLNYVAHSYSFAPLMMNYDFIDDHDMTTFDDWTMDGDYVYKNFGKDSKIKLVNDSDELFLVSFTKEDVLNIPYKKNFVINDRDIITATKAYHLNRLHNSDRIDPLKRMLFQEPILLHVDNISPRMHRRARWAKEIVTTAINLPADALWDRKLGAEERYSEVKVYLKRPDFGYYKLAFLRSKFYISICVLRWGLLFFIRCALVGRIGTFTYKLRRCLRKKFPNYFKSKYKYTVKPKADPASTVAPKPKSAAKSYG